MNAHKNIAVAGLLLALGLPIVQVNAIAATGGTVRVADVEALYAAVNNPANAGAMVVMAPGIYSLSVTDAAGGVRPNAGRIELQEDMSLSGVSGDRLAVVIDAASLPLASFTAPYGRTGVVRMGRGTNTVEWLTVLGNPEAAAGVATELTGTASTRVRIAHVISRGSMRGIDVRNVGAEMIGRSIDAELIDNECIAPTQVGSISEGVRLSNITGAHQGVVVATLNGNRVHGFQIGCIVANNGSSNATIHVRSSGDRFFANARGGVIVGGVLGNSNLTEFEAYGSEFVDNTATALRGLLVVGGDGGTRTDAASDNTLSISLNESKVEGNLGDDIDAFAARTMAPSGIAGANNHVTIALRGVSTKTEVVAVDSLPVDPSGSNTVSVTRPTRSETYAFTTFAGAPDARGYVDGAGSAARFYTPIGIAIDARGNLFVADGFDTYSGEGKAPGSSIRRITPDGIVTTVAGSATSVGSVDGTGSEARFTGPSGVAIDANGNLFVADGAFGGSVRKITPGGVVTTLARGLGDFFRPYGVAVDAAGNVFVTVNQAIRRITPAGVVTTFAGDENRSGSEDGIGTAARFTDPSGLAIDSSGNLFVAEFHTHTIRKITPAGVVTTIAGLTGMAGNADGVGRAARFSFPEGVAVDGNGNVLVVAGNGVRRINADGLVTTLAGKSDTADVGGTRYPRGIAINRRGEIYVTDGSRTVQKGLPFLGILPDIATQPQSYTAGRGRTAVFTVIASGSPAPTYRWTRNGSALAGATDATLVLNNVTAASAGTYQCIVTNAGGWVASYSAVLAVVDAIDPGRFSNFSVQASVGAGRSVTAGFVVEGTRQKTVLIRGIGPGLAQFGVRGALADPAVAVMRSNGERLAANDNWSAALASVFASTGAFALPAGSKDAAVLLPLPPGVYFAVLSAADGAGGEALIEIYEVP